MPLPATHIKFALDVKDKFDIKNLSEYLSGTVYPDSRFITKINRSCTHVSGLSLDDPSFSDFKKGWAVHCLCDKVQHQISDKYISDILEPLEKTDKRGGEWWVKHTALKIILDISVFKIYNIQKYLPMIEYVENANDENLEDIKNYIKIVQKTYQDKQEINLDDMKELWLSLGAEEELIEKVIKKTEEYLKDEKLVKRVEGLYEKMVGEVL